MLRAAYRTLVVAGNLISISVQWLHQRGITHNIHHETQLYHKATDHIMGEIIQAQNNQVMQANAAVIQAPHPPQTVTFTR